MREGDPVEHRRAVRTTSNHSAPGTLLGTVTTTRGKTLCVFEYDEPAGLVHISDPRQIRVGPHDFDAPATHFKNGRRNLGTI